MRECRLKSVFFFYWKDCLGVYVSDIKRNQILLLSSTHLNIILRFDFKPRLCGSLVGMCFPALTAIYTLFCFLFLSGSELVWKIMKMSSMQDIWIKKMLLYDIYKNEILKWNEGAGLLQYCVRRSISSVTKKNIVLHVYCVGEYQYKYKIVRGLYQ